MSGARPPAAPGSTTSRNLARLTPCLGENRKFCWASPTSEAFLSKASFPESTSVQPEPESTSVPGPTVKTFETGGSGAFESRIMELKKKPERDLEADLATLKPSPFLQLPFAGRICPLLSAFSSLITPRGTPQGNCDGLNVEKFLC